jgi:hypothetical protein
VSIAGEEEDATQFRARLSGDLSNEWMRDSKEWCGGDEYERVEKEKSGDEMR